MSFGSSSRRSSGGGNRPGGFDPMNNGGAPFIPRSPFGSVLLSGLMGLRPNSNPALSTSFASGGSGGLGRRPALSGRTTLGGM